MQWLHSGEGAQPWLVHPGRVPYHIRNMAHSAANNLRQLTIALESHKGNGRMPKQEASHLAASSKVRGWSLLHHHFYQAARDRCDRHGKRAGAAVQHRMHVGHIHVLRGRGERPMPRDYSCSSMKQTHTSVEMSMSTQSCPDVNTCGVPPATGRAPHRTWGSNASSPFSAGQNVGSLASASHRMLHNASAAAVVSGVCKKAGLVPAASLPDTASPAMAEPERMACQWAQHAP